MSEASSDKPVPPESGSSHQGVGSSGNDSSSAHSQSPEQASAYSDSAANLDSGYAASGRSSVRLSTGSGHSSNSDGQPTVISTRPPIHNLSLATPSESGSQWEGEQLGQFVLMKFVGGGGMGIVYRALDTTLDREVAVKVLSRDQSADDETLRRFRNEAQSAARLNHDNIARVFYVGEDRGVHYIVFEFIEGVNIRDLVDQQGPLPLAQALSYIYQIAHALDHASQRAVIHRDIKPSNVLVTPDGKAKLVDMGLARLSQMTPASNDLTASGVTLGTFDYISPEQARDPRSADVRSDLYSLGCSFYYILTGRPPFPEGTVLQKLLQHQADSPPDPRQERPELPPQVSRIVARLLAKNPNERYQQPTELIEELAVLGQSLGYPLGESQPPRIAARPAVAPAVWRKHLPWVVPVTALFLIVLLLDFYWSGNASKTLPAWSSRSETVAPRIEPPTLPLIEVPDASLPLPVEPSSASPGPASATPLAPKSGASKPAVRAPSAAVSPGEEASSEVVSTPSEDTETPSVPGSQVGEVLGGLVSRLQAASAARAAKASRGEAVSGEGKPARPTESTETLGAMPSEKVETQAGTVLTVGDESQPNNYMSLLAACSAAKDGDTIELRYNGRHTERPLAISNIKLTIQAGADFRPIVVFSPERNKPFTVNEMINVSGGQLLVRNVHWELDVPPDSPVDRSLFAAQHCDLIDLQDCTLTIRSLPPYYGGAAFFDLKAPPGANTMGMGAGTIDNHVVSISLKNCVVRGEANFLRSAELQPVLLTWSDGLLAISDRLLVAEGNSIQPRQEVRAEINLRNVTAMVGGGGVLMTNSQEEPHQVVVDLRGQDCILATPGAAPFVEQRGAAGIDEFLARFQWSGDSDYFSGFNTFWQVMNPSGPEGSKQLDFDAWRDRWQFTSTNQFSGRDAVVWAKLPASSRPFHTHLASDYVLDAGAAPNAASGGASDGGDAGAPLPYLPPLPEEASGSPRAPQGIRSEPAYME